MTVRDLTPNVTDCALAFEGGGYREAFSAGVATVLMDASLPAPPTPSITSLTTSGACARRS